MPHSYTRLDTCIQDDTSLASAADALHDAIFALEDVFFDEVSGIFRLTVWREVPELLRRDRVLFLLHRVTTARVRSVLEFTSVKRAAVETKDRHVSGEYCLEHASYDARSRRVEFRIMGPLGIRLQVDRLEGSLKDVGDPTWDAPSIPTFGVGR